MSREAALSCMRASRLDAPGRAYYRRKLADGKTRAEAHVASSGASPARYRQLLAGCSSTRSLPSLTNGKHEGTERTRFAFPRQRRDRRLCLADFFAAKVNER